MRIPEVRRQLSQAADDLRTGKRKQEAVAKTLDVLVTELWRKKARRMVGSAKRTPLTPELRNEIRMYAREHKALDLQEIANHFNVNPGRVSEIVSGERH